MVYASFRMQLAVDVQIPDEFGGLNGEAIYIGILRLLFIDSLESILNISQVISHFLALLKGFQKLFRHVLKPGTLEHLWNTLLKANPNHQKH